MRRFFEQTRSELGLGRKTTLFALQSLFEWLDRHVAADHTLLLVRAARPAQASSNRRLEGLIHRTLTAIDSPHSEDISLAMTLRAAGLTLDQVDPFVELFLANLQLQATASIEPYTNRLSEWLDRGQTEEGFVGLPH